MGNPELKPLTNPNQNLSVEWYPNKDNNFSFSYYKQHGIIGAPTLIEGVTGAKMFAGSGAVPNKSKRHREHAMCPPRDRTGRGARVTVSYLPDHEPRCAPSRVRRQ